MRPDETVMRKRVIGAWINREPAVVTATRVPVLRNNSGGLSAQTPQLIPDIKGRLTHSRTLRRRPGRQETDIGLVERDYDRFVSLPNDDLTKVLMAGDTFSWEEHDYECTKIIPYSYQRIATIEKR